MDKKLEKLVNAYEPEELKAILKQIKRNPKTPRKPYKLDGKEYSMGIISDTHIGNKCYDSELMDLAVKEFDKHKVDFVLHCGDICDGLYTNRQGHVFELEHIGADEQTERAVEELSKINQHLFYITGNHTYNTFYKNAGHDVGKRIEELIGKDNVTYLGNGDGEISVAHNKTIKLLHPDGGSSYAISYKSQKIIESFEGGTKPEMLFIGHFHKAEYIFYRNVHCFQAGTLEAQTPFMKGRGLSAHRGFWIVNFKVNKKGVTKLSPTFYPAY